MSVKIKVLEVLENNRDKYVSGQEIANNLGVSRSAVWKAIKNLEKDNHKIKAITNKGYILDNKSNVISEQGVIHYLNKEYRNIKIKYDKVVTSTNDLAKQFILNENLNEIIVLADKQTAGKGRLGRSFYSPEKTGIYMSIALKPKIHISDISIITIMTALIVCEAIENFTNSKAQIKWVNDIFVNQKKVCGILTEAISNFENGIVESIIIGIGININTKNFPENLKNIAGNITDKIINRNQIIAYIINRLLDSKINFDKPKLIEQYKKRLFILDKSIIYYKNNKQYKGIAIDISQNGELIIKNELGEIEKLNSGEISLKI